jgi:hypothetical protein
VSVVVVWTGPAETAASTRPRLRTFTSQSRATDINRRFETMNKVRVQTWNFRDEIVDDKTLDVWTGLEDFLDDVYTRFSGQTLKRVSFEKVKR